MLGEPITTLLHKLQSQKAASAYSSSDGLVNVHKLTERAGAAYEKLRYLIDYKDERHIRRSAIERIIKRKIIIEKGEGIGLSLVQELVAGRYLPNNAISEKAALDVEKIIGKYKTLESSMPESLRNEPRARKVLVRLMASEIEDFFYPSNEDDFLAEAFYDSVKNAVRVEEPLAGKDLETQTLIACYRALLNTDDETLFYKLWLKRLPPEWVVLDDSTVMRNIGEKSFEIWSEIHSALEYPLSFKLLPRFYNYAIYFSIIREVVRAYGAESERILSDRAALEQFIRQFLENNYKRQYGKARSSAIRAVFYIFLSKMLLALALEVPYQVYFLKDIEWAPIATNTLFHPTLLFVISIFVRPLGDKNTEAIVSGVENAVSGGDIRPIKVKIKGSGFFNSLFLFLYAGLFLLVFGFIVGVLRRFNWSIVSILLFTLFLTLVSYFAIRIRHSANKWRVSGENDSVIGMAFNLFSLPIVRAGKWLSRKFSSINLFAFILDFVIETPFKMLLQLGDAFVSFLKEKQEDVY